MQTYYVTPHSNLPGSWAVHSREYDAWAKQIGTGCVPIVGTYKTKKGAEKKAAAMNAATIRVPESRTGFRGE